ATYALRNASIATSSRARRGHELWYTEIHRRSWKRSKGGGAVSCGAREAESCGPIVLIRTTSATGPRPAGSHSFHRLTNPNHVSVLDPIAIALGAAARGRAIRFLAATEFFAHPLWGPSLRAGRAVPVRRGARDLASLERFMNEVRAGSLVGIFPEGMVMAEA